MPTVYEAAIAHLQAGHFVFCRSTEPGTICFYWLHIPMSNCPYLWSVDPGLRLQAVIGISQMLENAYLGDDEDA